ncbi:MAG TPA: phosphoribosylamine--glycine ligase, partial [Candidatus Paceibacterota bacterium]
IFGPRSAAAQIEKSKAFARGVMSEAMIDQPDHAVFDDYGKALEYVRARNTACFVKEDGPALGKGAHRCETIEKAQEKLHELMVQNKKRVLVEELLDGYELSAHALCHDTTSLLFPFSQDHKYSGDGDTGDMTGGMGVVVPASRSEVITTITREEIVQGILHELLAQRNPYRGLLYPGLMITKNRVKVLECNARFGDPETQTYVRHLISPGLAEMLVATIDGGLERIVPVWEPGFSVCIVMASGGYPGSYQKGFPITGIEHAEEVTGVKVFHAGTAIKGGRLVTNGGRVLGVTCCAETLDLALGRAYKAVNRIQFENKHVRYDIGAKLLGKSPGT